MGMYLSAEMFANNFFVSASTTGTANGLSWDNATTTLASTVTLAKAD
ncbi:MAG: hypothetical protein GZ091_02680 [Paludibacter sp.]|nr:hypothetical protein [Paludibacter sp.]